MNILKSTQKKKTVKKDILGNTVIEDDKGNKKTIKKDIFDNIADYYRKIKCIKAFPLQKLTLQKE